MGFRVAGAFLNFRELEKAWLLRQKLELGARSEAYRVFHGPGEARGVLARYAVDRFGAHTWITEWESTETVSAEEQATALNGIARFLEAQGMVSGVLLERPRGGIPSEPRALFGTPPQAPFPVREHDSRFLIRLMGSRHPGLFLDHEPLRKWLAENAESWKVLNCFAYTGSLSVAAGIGGADHVTTLDLSKPTISWARDNWALNGLEAGAADFIAGDVFEKLPRFAKQPALFDCVILDPPSFSRGKKGSFSTQKDLFRLHKQALSVLQSGGTLITSINSVNVSRAKFRDEVRRAASECGVGLSPILEIKAPPSFPSQSDYLKGWVFQVRPAKGLKAGAPRKKEFRA